MDDRTPRRIRREMATLDVMVRLYCRAHHAPAGADLCPACAGLARYARARTLRCHAGAAKPTCAHCPVHCYAPAMREQVRAVMRYAGPRMLWRHPWLALSHLWDHLRRGSVG